MNSDHDIESTEHLLQKLKKIKLDSDAQGDRWRFSGNIQCWFQMDAAGQSSVGDHPVFLIAELAENLLHAVVRAGGMSPDALTGNVSAFRK